MKAESKLIIENLGFFFFGIVLLALQLAALVFLMVINYVLQHIRIWRLIQKWNLELFWGSILVLVIEGYLDFTLSAFLNMEDLTWLSGDDKFNSFVAILAIPLVLIFPIWSLWFLRKNKT